MHLVTAPPLAALPQTASGTGQDLRGRLVDELHYGADSVLVVAGVPGAGKTTLLRRLFPHGTQPGPASAFPVVRMLDSEHTRIWWHRYLRRLPYRLWRPVVHVSHYLRLLHALRGQGPVVVHECATRAWVRYLIIAAACRSGRQPHLLLLDVEPRDALAGQQARDRRVRPSAFAAHCRNWHHLIHSVTSLPRPTHRDAATVTVIDRAGAARLRAINFHPAAGR